MAECTKYTNVEVLEACRAYFGREDLLCIEPAIGLTGGESFIYSTLSTSYQIWFSVGAVGSAPVPANGETLIEVALPASYTLADFAEAMISDLSDTFYVHDPKADHSHILLENFDAGSILAPGADVDTSFTFHAIVNGFIEDLGATNEGITVSIETGKLDVTANQTGPLITSQILQSTASSLTMGLQQVGTDRLRRLIADGFGDAFTPSGGTELIGYGTSKVGQNTLELAGRLILRPLRLGANDRSEDLNYWKTVPEITEFNNSGTDIKVYSTSFVALNDEFKAPEISVMAFGDGSQNLAPV